MRQSRQNEAINIEIQPPIATIRHSHTTLALTQHTQLYIELHRLSADNRYRPIISIDRLFVLVSKTTKNAFNCSSHWWQWCN